MIFISMMLLYIWSIIALILLMWFRTEVWLEYTNLFCLGYLSFYKDYQLKKQEDISLTYILYLRRYHNSFFILMITCPVCFAVWLGILIGIFTSIILIPVYIVGGLLIFSIIDKLLGWYGNTQCQSVLIIYSTIWNKQFTCVIYPARKLPE